MASRRASSVYFIRAMIYNASPTIALYFSLFFIFLFSGALYSAHIFRITRSASSPYRLARTTLSLPSALVWADEYTWSPIEQTQTYTTTGALLIAQLTAGRRPIELPVPRSMLLAQPIGQRYLGLRYTIGGSNATAGKFTAGIHALSFQDIGKNYPVGYTIT